MKNAPESISGVEEVVVGETSLQLAGQRLTKSAPWRTWPLERDMNLGDYWRIVRNRLRLVCVIVIVVTVCSVIWVFSQPDYYESKARVEIGLESLSSGLVDVNEADAINTYPIYLNTQLQLIKSPTLLGRVVTKLDLEHNSVFLHHITKRGRPVGPLRPLLRFVHLGKAEREDQAAPHGKDVPLSDSSVPPHDLLQARRLSPFVADIQKKLTAGAVREDRSASRETRLVDILYWDSTPQLAASIVNGVATELVLFNKEKQAENGDVVSRYLKRRTAELQAQIREDEQRLLEYGRDHQILSLDASQNTALDRLAALNRQLVEAENERKSAEANYRAALDPDAASSLAEQDARQIIEARSKLEDLQQQRAQLLVGTTEKWPQTQEVDEQIAVLQKYINETHHRAMSVNLTNLHTHYRQALGREQAVRASFNQQRGVMLTQNEAAVNYRLIQQGIDTNKTLLNDLLKHLGENDVAQARIANNIQVVDYAIIADKVEPDGPRRLPYVALAFMLSLSFAVGLALFLESLDNTLRCSDDVEVILRLPALGVIPAAETAKRASIVSRFGLDAHN